MGNGQENMGKAVISEFRQIRYKPCFSKCDKINISVWLRNENSTYYICIDLRWPHTMKCKLCVLHMHCSNLSIFKFNEARSQKEDIRKIIRKVTTLISETANIISLEYITVYPIIYINWNVAMRGSRGGGIRGSGPPSPTKFTFL